MTRDEEKSFLRQFVESPHLLLIGGFAAVILCGGVLLWTPWAGNVSFLDALFTSTSAVCVTGLTVVDTATAFTPLGKMIIMALIQVGGLGVMTYAALGFKILGRRLSLRSLAVLQDAFLQRDAASEFRQMFKRILAITATLELAGVVVICVSLLPSQSLGDALWSGLFHSVSAFCNAGFSIYTDNLVAIRDNLGVTIAIMSLIVLGGLGFNVLHECFLALVLVVRRRKKSRPRFFSFHARVVLRVTVGLIIVGTVGLLLFGLTPGEQSFGEKVSGALFQSVTARTAGFNTVNIGALPLASLFLLVLLMFVGGSPASTAGGIKTTGLAVWFARMRAVLRGKQETVLLGHELPDDLVRRTGLLISLAVIWNIFGFLLLLVSEGGRAGVGMHDVIFEQISAFGTVGLSTGLTPTFSAAGKIWLITTMFLGRLGPLAIASWVFAESRVQVSFPEGRLMIG